MLHHFQNSPHVFQCLCHHPEISTPFSTRQGPSPKNGRKEMKWNRDFYCKMKLLNLWKSWVLIINLDENQIMSIEARLVHPCFMDTRDFFSQIFQFFNEGVTGKIKECSLRDWKSDDNQKLWFQQLHTEEKSVPERGKKHTIAINLSSKSREATTSENWKLKIMKIHRVAVALQSQIAKRSERATGRRGTSSD